MNKLYALVARFVCYANDNSAFIPAIWSQMGLAILEENMVMANLVHRDFENDVREYGDTVNTRRPGSFQIRRKTDATTLTQQDANATNVQVKLDQWFYTSFVIKDGERTKSFQDLVTVYLLPDAVNNKVQPLLDKQLKKGARIVAKDFDFRNWTPEKVENIADDGEGRSHTLYLYRK